MSRSVLGALVLALLSLTAARAANMDVLVSIQAQQQPLRAVLGALSQQTGVPITVDDRVLDKPVAIDLKDQPLTTALNLLTRSTGLVWYQQNGTVVVTLEPNQRVHLDSLGDLPAAAVALPAEFLARTVTAGFDNVPLSDLFTTLSRVTETSIVMDRTVPTSLKVTASFNAVPLTRCLYMVGLSAGVYYRAEPNKTLHVYVPDRVTTMREDGKPQTVESYPGDYRGVLGYLIVEDFWRDPGRYGARLRLDARQQPFFETVVNP